MLHGFPRMNTRYIRDQRCHAPVPGCRAIVMARTEYVAKCRARTTKSRAGGAAFNPRARNAEDGSKRVLLEDFEPLACKLLRGGDLAGAHFLGDLVAPALGFFHAARRW